MIGMTMQDGEKETPTKSDHLQRSEGKCERGDNYTTAKAAPNPLSFNLGPHTHAPGIFSSLPLFFVPPRVDTYPSPRHLDFLLRTLLRRERGSCRTPYEAEGVAVHNRTPAAAVAYTPSLEHRPRCPHPLLVVHNSTEKLVVAAAAERGRIEEHRKGYKDRASAHEAVGVRSKVRDVEILRGRRRIGRFGREPARADEGP